MNNDSPSHVMISFPSATKASAWVAASALTLLATANAADDLPPADESLQTVPIVRNQESPHARLASVGLNSVRWTDGFWSQRYAQCRDVTLRKLWALAADPDAGHVLDNMRIAGGVANGEFAGTNWQDAWLCKWIESAAAFHAIEHDPWIEERMDEAIELIAAAQEDDGYIATQITARKKPRFQDPREHEVYSMGHLLTAACVHHRATGKDSLLKVAVRCGDFLCKTLGVSVGPSYHLPSADCYNETCGQIGNLMWNYRMLCAKPEAKYADLMELELYNGFLAGIGLDGESWFYRNSLRRHDIEHAEDGHNDLAERVLPGRKRICCPTNLLRTFAELQGYLYTLDDEGLWIHHYGGNVFEGRLENGARFKIRRQTDYPWDGKVAVTLDEVEAPGPFAIRLRIPGWAGGATVSINGKASANPPKAGRYLSMERGWRSGDVMELNLPMQPRLMQAHPKAEQLRNQVAVMRGPVLYCIESKDLPDGIDLNNIYIPDDIDLQPRAADDLPFGILALTGKAIYRPEAPWETELYRKVVRASPQAQPIRMIPYFSWANRGASAMSSWLPVVWSK